MKTCAECNAEFSRPPGRSAAQWAGMRWCSASCANTWRARGGRAQRPGDLSKRAIGRTTYLRIWQQRRAMPRWATEWEDRRRAEDLADIGTWRARGPVCRLKDRPAVRTFLGWYCEACGNPFVYYAKRAQSSYCAPCNEAHHRRSANRRARQKGAAYEPIDSQRVFERDGHRCQLCKRKTRGKFPHPRSATIDHIIPLSEGGPHLYVNVQCACFECNWKKREGAADDQLLLVG